MGKSKIEWTDFTFNPWYGCTKISVGPLGACENCYAESWAKRAGKDVWGDRPRIRTTESYWYQPQKWNRAAELAGARYRVFCASLADVFDNQVPQEWRVDLFDLIRETPNLDWLLLTKRIGNVWNMVPFLNGIADLPENVWLGATIASQEEAERDIPKLLAAPACQVRFLSCEPLLGPLDVSRWLHGISPRVNWVICGGESGSKARPLLVSWAEGLQQQCQAAGAAFFMKQGSRANWPDFKFFESFPPSIRVREFPDNQLPKQEP